MGHLSHFPSSGSQVHQLAVDNKYCSSVQCRERIQKLLPFENSFTMGTAHSFAHRLTALSMACLASAGIIFSIFAGMSCSFVQVQAKPGRNVMTATGDLFDAQVGFFGVMCVESPFYDESDRLWSLSQLFFYISVGFGGLTTLVAWALTLCIPPTGCRWRTMSILSAIAAVMQVPVFLIFESDNCNFDVNRQTCKLAMGAYMNMMSVIIWVVMTIWTQCLKVPEWDKEGLHAWKVESSQNQSEISSKEHKEPRSFYSTESGGSEEEDFPYPPQSSPLRSSRNDASNMGTSAELLWVSMEEHGQHRGAEQTLFPSRARALRRQREEELENGVQRDASCMERILTRGGRNSKKDIQNHSQLSSCMPLPAEEEDPGMIEGAAATVMQSVEHQSLSACQSFPGMSYSVAGRSQDAVCAGATCDDEAYPIYDGAKSVKGASSKSTGSYSTSQTNNEKCEDVNLSCVAQHVKQLPAAMAACIVSSCEEEQEEPGEFHMVDGIPEIDMRNASSRRQSRTGMHGDNEQHQKHDDDDTHRIDYLTKRLRSDMAAAAHVETRSKVAPMKSIHIDTSFIQENDHNDDVSEMTRGSGLASGVSEVLDSQRRHQNDDPMTILEDLARTY